MAWIANAVLIVALEALAGIACPLTVWENHLRGTANGDFIARWLHRALYYDLPAWAFTLAYLLFAAAVLLTFRFIPPQKRSPQ